MGEDGKALIPTCYETNINIPAVGCFNRVNTAERSRSSAVSSLQTGLKEWSYSPSQTCVSCGHSELTECTALRMTARNFGISAVVLTLLGWATNANALNSCCPGNNLFDLDVQPEHCSGHTEAVLQIRCNDTGMFILNPNLYPDDNFTVNPVTGTLQVGQDSTELMQPDEYCLTRTISDGEISEQDVALVCFSEVDFSPNKSHYLFYIYSICLLISSVFLLITLIVYLLVPELRDLQGKCLMFTMLSLFIAYISLAVLQLHSSSFSSTTCISFAFFTYFWMLSAFFWLHVVSFNVWKSVIYHHFPFSDSQQLIFYCMFGWGGPLIFLIAVLITHHLPSDNILPPNFGVSKCWFQGPAETWAYFYGPIAVLLCGNSIYFIWTAWRLWKDCRGQSVPKLRCLRYKCLLYLKLFLVMGISWIFELISALIDESTGFWLVTDIFNCLQGLIIFLLMVVFRKKALRGLVKHDSWGFQCPKRWAEGVDEESETMLAEEEELSQIRT